MSRSRNMGVNVNIRTRISIDNGAGAIPLISNGPYFSEASDQTQGTRPGGDPIRRPKKGSEGFFRCGQSVRHFYDSNLMLPLGIRTGPERQRPGRRTHEWRGARKSDQCYFDHYQTFRMWKWQAVVRLRECRHVNLRRVGSNQ